jgi:hypothetical protein
MAVAFLYKERIPLSGFIWYPFANHNRRQKKLDKNTCALHRECQRPSEAKGCIDLWIALKAYHAASGSNRRLEEPSRACGGMNHESVGRGGHKHDPGAARLVEAKLRDYTQAIEHVGVPVVRLIRAMRRREGAHRRSTPHSPDGERSQGSGNGSWAPSSAFCAERL